MAVASTSTASVRHTATSSSTLAVSNREALRVSLMAGTTGEESDRLDPELLRDEVLHFLELRRDCPSGAVLLQRTKHAFEALGAVSHSLSVPAIALAWSLLQTEVVCSIPLD